MMLVFAVSRAHQVWAAQVSVNDRRLAAMQEHHATGYVTQHVQPAGDRSMQGHNQKGGHSKMPQQHQSTLQAASCRLPAAG
jgi:hypothetical protein